MPTILFVMGWRFFFYSNENKEPIHIIVKKLKKNANIGLIPKYLISMKHIVII